MAIIKFSKVGPAAQAPGATGMLSAQIGLMKAQRGAASMKAAVDAVQLGDAAMKSAPLNAAIDEIKMRAGQVYDWATDKPPSAAEERVRLRREAASAAGSGAGADAKAKYDAEYQRGLQYAREEFTPEQVPGFGQKPMAAQSMSSRAIEAISSGAEGVGPLLGHPRVQAMASGYGSPVEAMHAGAMKAYQADLGGYRPVGQMQVLDAADKAAQFGSWISGWLPSSVTAAKVIPHVTPAHSTTDIGRGMVASMFGEDPRAALGAGGESSPSGFISELEGISVGPVGAGFRSPPSGVAGSPKRALGLAVTQAERAAMDVSPRVTNKFKAATKRAEIFEIVKRLDAAKRRPRAWPPVNPLTGEPYNIDEMELGGLVALAEERPLGPDQVAELIVLAREKAVSDGLLNLFGGKYKNEAADAIYEAQRLWRKNNPPLDLVKVAGRIARMDRTGAGERKLDAETEGEMVDTYWTNAQGSAKTHNLWMKHAMSPTGRKWLLRGGIKRAGGGRRAHSLTLGWDLNKSTGDTSTNADKGDGKSNNHDLYVNLTNMALGGDKGAKAAIAGLKVHYDIENSGQKISDAVAAVNAKLQIMADKEARLKGRPKSAAYRKWAAQNTVKMANWKAAIGTNEALFVAAKWVDPPKLLESEARVLAMATAFLSHAANEPGVSEVEAARRPGPDPQATKQKEVVTINSSREAKLAAGWIEHPNGIWEAPKKK